jgi:hypothetical protein
MAQPFYKDSAYWSESPTVGWLIAILRDAEEVQARINARKGPPAYGSAEMQACVEDHRDSRVFSGVLAQAAGIGRMRLLCDELDNGAGLTRVNVLKLRARVCRAKPCSLEEANQLSLDAAATVLEVLAKETGTHSLAAPGEWITATHAVELSERTRRPVSASVLSRKAKQQPPPFKARRAQSGNAKVEVEKASFLDWLHSVWLPKASDEQEPTEEPDHE